MTIKMPEDDPKSNLIGFPIGKRKGTLEPVRKKYDACKHEAVFVEDGIREVTCQKCGVVLDAFTVLFELAWKQRRWLEELDAWDALRESRLSDRYDAQWERDHEAVVAPPADPSLREVWDVFHSYFGDKFCGMYNRKKRKRMGPGWYGKSTYGATVSLEYARSSMIAKAVSK
jgi:hypothetical protein